MLLNGMMFIVRQIYFASMNFDLAETVTFQIGSCRPSLRLQELSIHNYSRDFVRYGHAGVVVIKKYRISVEK
jgi:hypothetical protein